jgi:hypothetical protein
MVVIAPVASTPADPEAEHLDLHPGLQNQKSLTLDFIAGSQLVCDWSLIQQIANTGASLFRVVLTASLGCTGLSSLDWSRLLGPQAKVLLSCVMTKTREN